MHRARRLASKAGLRYYVGAANLADDGGYAGKVLAEHERLRQVVGGRAPPTTATAAPPGVRATAAARGRRRAKPEAATPQSGGAAAPTCRPFATAASAVSYTRPARDWR